MTSVSKAEIETAARSMKPGDLKKLFHLEKRAEKESKHIGVRIFVDFINRRRLFGSSLREEIKAIHDDISELKTVHDQYLDIKDHDPGMARHFFGKEHELESQIYKKLHSLMEKVSEGNSLIVEMANNLSRFLNDEAKILELLQMVYKKSRGRNFTHLAAHIQGGLHILKPLFDSISTTYHGMELDLNKHIGEQIINARNKDATIDFREVLSAIERVEGTLDRILADAEKAGCKLNIESKDNHDLMGATLLMLRVQKKLPSDPSN